MVTRTMVIGRLVLLISIAAMLHPFIAEAGKYQDEERAYLALHSEAAAADSRQLPVLEDRAKKGDVRAQLILGYKYLAGAGIAKDPTAAFTWMQRSAKAGDPQARFLLGDMYYSGVGVKKDLDAAVRWYRMAAEQGHVSAQSAIGHAYQDAGTKISVEEAITWLKKAADQGDPASAYRLAKIYQDGDGVVASSSEAFRWMQKAAHADSFYAGDLADMYYDGVGTEMNREEAVKWYKKNAGIHGEERIEVAFLSEEDLLARSDIRNMLTCIEVYRADTNEYPLDIPGSCSLSKAVKCNYQRTATAYQISCSHEAGDHRYSFDSQPPYKVIQQKKETFDKKSR